MRGQKSKELAKLEEGLAQSKDLTDIISSLQPQSAHQLFSKALYYTKWTGFMMSVAGIYFLALKEKTGYGSFKKYLGDHRFLYHHAWECMKAAHVVSRHELFGKLRSSHSFRKLLSLPEPDQDKLAAELKEIPTDRLDEMLPSLIQKRYDEIRDEERKARPHKGKPLSDEEVARLQADLARRKQDGAWENVFRLWTDAVGALGQLADAAEKVDMQERHFDEVFKRNMMAPLATQFDRLVHKWRPIEEIQKRAEVIERPSFAAR